MPSPISPAPAQAAGTLRARPAVSTPQAAMAKSTAATRPPRHLNHTPPADLGFTYPSTLGVAEGPPFFIVNGYASIGDPITGPVAADATNINFGAILTGSGTAWFDGLSVELDGAYYAATNALDLDFESRPPAGFYLGGAGYEVQTDSAVFHSGKSSLRMKRTGPGSSAAAASATWKNMVAHLEASREAYRNRGLVPRDIAWAIQNARVVLQCMEMRANQVSRDRSMADNVQWILNQSPKAKVVLWAHNGHVAAAPQGAWEPTVRSCARFTAARWSFSALRSTRARSRPWAAASSATSPFRPLPLAATTGIPLFALDLRSVEGPAAAWLNEPHQSRSIGAVYSEDNAAAFFADMALPRFYDAILVVEKTTAARKN
jgi:hypothetical protein